MRRLHWFRAILPGLIAAGCGGGGDGGGGTPPPNPTVASVVVALASSSVAVGQTTTATATARDAQGGTIGGKTPAWSSSNAAVASVDASGTVTGVSPGSADIVATIDGRTGQAAVTVTAPAVATVAVTLGAPTLAPGQVTQAVAVLRDAAGSTLSGRTVTWSSSATSVATVSATGLVTGVSAGSATITATSEGRTGQATVSVISTAVVGPITLTAPGGQPIDTSRVAGTIVLQYDVSLPPGWRGVREVRIGTRVFRRDSVFGAAPLTSARLIPAQVEANVATPVAILNGDDLRLDMLPNGRQELQLQHIGGVGNGAPTSVTSSTSFSTRQNGALFLFTKPTKVVSVAGTDVVSGDITARIGHASPTGDVLERIEVLRGPHQAVYGPGSTASLVSLITRTGSEVSREFTIPKSAFAGESPSAGNGFVVRARIGGVAIDPTVTLYSTNGWASSINGSGLAHPSPSAAGVTLPPNVALQYTPAPDVSAILPGYQPYADRFHYDNGVSIPAGAFSILQANTQVGSPIYVTGTETGSVANRIRSNYDFRLGVSYSGFSDRTGIDQGKTTFRYGPLVTAKSLWNPWSPGTSLPGTSGAYTYGAEACFEDLAGNQSCADLVTNGINNITSNGSPGGLNLRASYAIGGGGGTMTFGGVANPFVNTWPTVGTAARTATASNVPTGFLPPAFAAWKVDFSVGATTRTLFGKGAGGTIPELYPTALGGTGGNANFAFSTWTARAQSLYGTDEGVYAGTFHYRLADGQPFGTPWPTVRLVNDRTAPLRPTISYQGAPVRGSWDAMATGSDNVALGGHAWGFQSTKPDTRFHTGQFYWFDASAPIGGGAAAPLEASGTWAIGGVVPGSVTFADNTGGFASSSPFGLDAFLDKFWDLGGNPSLEEFVAFLALAPDRQATPPDRFEQYQSGPSACVGTSAFCGSIPRTRFLDGGITTLTNALFTPKIDVFGVHGATKRVHYFGSSTSTQINPFSGKYRTFYFVPFDAGTFGGPAGSYDLFSIARRMDDVFVSNFQPFTVLKGQP